MTVLEVKGLSDTLRTLAALPDRLAKKGLSAAMRAGAREWVKVAKAQAQTAFTSRTGATVRNIGLARGKKPSPLVARYVIGVRHLAGKMGEGRSARALRKIKTQRGLRQALTDAGISYEQLAALSGRKLARRGLNPYYYRFLELGTQHMAARPFLAPSTGPAQARVLPVVISKLRDELPKLIRELKR